MLSGGNPTYSREPLSWRSEHTGPQIGTVVWAEIQQDPIGSVVPRSRNGVKRSGASSKTSEWASRRLVNSASARPSAGHKRFADAKLRAHPEVLEEAPDLFTPFR